MSVGPDRCATRPRVLHVTTAHRADDVRIFERECRSLAASGRYDVFLAAAGSIPAGSGVTFLPLPPRPSSRAGRFSAGPRRALALTRALSMDVWHFHDPELLPVALKLARGGRAVVWDAHEDYLTQLSEAGAKDWVPAPARRVVLAGTSALLSTVDKHAAGVVAATPTIASKYSNPRTVVVGNETKLEWFTSCRPSFDARLVLFTGGVGPMHLFDEVVEGVALVPGARLAVAGRPPDPSTWAAAEETLGDRLSHLGWLDREGLARAMSSASLGLATYADTSAYASAAPTKLFEFAAAGLPAVASPTQANTAHLTDSGAGFLADGFTAPDLARAIDTALSDEAGWRAASESGRRWAAAAGSWEQSEARLLGLYESILAGYEPAAAGVSR